MQRNPDFRKFPRWPAVDLELKDINDVPGGTPPYMNAARVEPLRTVIATEQIQKRIKELGRQISDDYKGQTIQLLAVLENAFMFLADLVRAIEVPVVCQFITRNGPGKESASKSCSRL